MTIEKLDKSPDFIEIPKLENNDPKQNEIFISEYSFDEDVEELRKYKSQSEMDARELKEVYKKIGLEEVDDTKTYTPEEVLRQLAGYNERYVRFPIEAVVDGSFAGNGKLTIDSGDVVLVRYAHDGAHLVKFGRSASPEEMINSSEYNGGASKAGAIHTSADLVHWRVSSANIVGIFRIPVKELLQLGKKGKILIGNLGESEIILSGDIAAHYLAEVEDISTGKKILL